MRKIILIIFLIILIFAVSINLPDIDIDITGLFLKATSTLLEVIKAVAKQVLTFIASKL